MSKEILGYIDDKNTYLIVEKALANGKTDFTEEEIAGLLKAYRKYLSEWRSIRDESLLKMILVLDTANPTGDKPIANAPLAHLLSETDQAGLEALEALRATDGGKIQTTLDAAKLVSNTEISPVLGLALARAILDALAQRKDVSKYRDTVESMTEILRNADEDVFSQTSRFLVMTRGWAR